MFAPLKLGAVFGEVQLCGRAGGQPSSTLSSGDRPVPSASGTCPTGTQLCGVHAGMDSSVPNWDRNRALCFDSSLPCPVRNVSVAETLDMLLDLGVVDFAGRLQDSHSVFSGDTLLLFNGTVTGSNATALEVTLQVRSSAGNESVVLTHFSTTGNSSTTVSIAEALEWNYTALISRASSAPVPRTPIVFALPSTGGQVCLHSRPNQPRSFDGPGSLGFNAFDPACGADDVDGRWTHTGSAAMGPLLRQAFADTALCVNSSNTASLAQNIACSECLSFDGICSALACDTGCSVLETYAVAHEGIGQSVSSFSGPPITDPPATIALRAESFWRSDCPQSRQEMLDVLSPLDSIETLQRDAVVLVAVLSSVAIVFSLLQLFTLHEDGMFGVLVCLPFGLGLHKYGRKPCGVTDRCLGDRITQRIVIGFGAVMTGLPMGVAKVIFLSIVTAQIGTVRSVLSVWADSSVQCSDEGLTNEALQRLGASISDTFTNNLVAIIIECVLVASSASGAVAELTDGHRLCQKTIAEAEEL